jgi:hypothetical protein
MKAAGRPSVSGRGPLGRSLRASATDGNKIRLSDYVALVE